MAQPTTRRRAATTAASGPVVYQIVREPESTVTCWVHDRAGVHPLQHFVFHSPDGFELGYAGSGPAELALAILADVLGEDLGSYQQPGPDLKGSRAWERHQEFKDAFLAARSVRNGLTLTRQTVLDWLALQ